MVEHSEFDEIKNLIEIIFDPQEDFATIDDAVIDLGYYNNNKALEALIQASISSHIEDDTILQNIGESIFDIWNKRDYFSKEVFFRLRKPTRAAILGCIRNHRTEWIEQYSISLDNELNTEEYKPSSSD